MNAAIITLDDRLLDEVVHAAVAAGLFLISDGRRIVVSPVVPPGFVKIAVKVKPQPENAEGMPCAA